MLPKIAKITNNCQDCQGIPKLHRVHDTCRNFLIVLLNDYLLSVSWGGDNIDRIFPSVVLAGVFKSHICA